MSGEDLWDVVIVGGGPAGLASALYAARDRYRTLVLEKNGLPGGQIMLTDRVENYPGIVKIGGFELIEEQKKQVLNFGAVIAPSQACSSLRRRDDGILEIEVNGGEKSYLARAVILAPGSDYRRLGVPGEDEMRKATRVSYCATCDGAFYRDKHVLCIGGGNTAVEDTIYLATRFCRKVTMIHRRREFRAQEVLVEELHKAARERGIDIKLPYVVEEIVGSADKTDLDHVRIRNVQTGQVERLKVDGVFVFVGMTPNTGFLRGVVEMNQAGYIACDPVTMKTASPGVFVAGDCRQLAAMQLATACADGVVAAMGLKAHYRDPSAWSKKTADDNDQPKGW
jgi:thioredoxin reductase (NADPH)